MKSLIILLKLIVRYEMLLLYFENLKIRKADYEKAEEGHDIAVSDLIMITACRRKIKKLIRKGNLHNTEVQISVK